MGEMKMGIKRSKIDKYKMGLAENLARDYAMLGEDEIERRKALRDKLWLLFGSDIGMSCNAVPATVASGIGRSIVFAYIRAKTKAQTNEEQLRTIAEYADISVTKSIYLIRLYPSIIR
jgi:hypothetical protein